MRAKRPYAKTRKRLGRGIGSGHGKTSTKGHKGQKRNSGAGARIRPGFEGGQNPLYRKLPKRGFNNRAFAVDYAVVNLDRIEKLGLTEVTPQILVERGVIRTAKLGLKVLGNGDLSRAVIIKAQKFSDSAKLKIEKASGQAVLID